MKAVAKAKFIRLSIFTYDSTSMMESMALNLPTMLLDTRQLGLAAFCAALLDDGGCVDFP